MAWKPKSPRAEAAYSEADRFLKSRFGVPNRFKRAISDGWRLYNDATTEREAKLALAVIRDEAESWARAESKESGGAYLKAAILGLRDVLAAVQLLMIGYDCSLDATGNITRDEILEGCPNCEDDQVIAFGDCFG